MNALISTGVKKYSEQFDKNYAAVSELLFSPYLEEKLRWSSMVFIKYIIRLLEELGREEFSSLMWVLVLNDILKIFERTGVKVVAHANDVVILKSCKLFKIWQSRLGTDKGSQYKTTKDWNGDTGHRTLEKQF